MQQDQYLRAAASPDVSGRRLYFACKRGFDLCVALLACIVTAPLLLLIAALIKLDSPGPVLFRQVRLGRGGRPFVFYKFRTMHHNVSPEVHRKYMQSFIHSQGSEGAQGGTMFKLTRDPRITRVGRLLRITSLDELPQVFNVLRGDMSLVGPRPPVPYEVLMYRDWHRQRMEAIPGITGLWQVRGRSCVPFDEMVRMDLEYMASQSLWLDLKILLLTIPAVLTARGAK